MGAVEFVEVMVAASAGACLGAVAPALVRALRSGHLKHKQLTVGGSRPDLHFQTEVGDVSKAWADRVGRPDVAGFAAGYLSDLADLFANRAGGRP